MGLGKTLQAITYLLDTHKTWLTFIGRRPHLGPARMVCRSEEVCSELKVYVHHGSNRRDSVDDSVDVVVTSRILRLDSQFLNALANRYFG